MLEASSKNISNFNNSQKNYSMFSSVNFMWENFRNKIRNIIKLILSNTKKQRKMSVKLALSKEGRGRGGGREKDQLSSSN